MKCKNCSQEIDHGNTCPSCGYALNKCQKCGNNCNLDDKYCNECGQKLIAKTIKKTPTPSTITHPDLPQKINETIRKHGTILFTDMKGSTALIQSLDPEEASNILSPVLKEMLNAVHRYDGTVVHTAGDGIVAIFGAPHSLEDHALRACLAALSIQTTINSINPNVQIRVGLNSGEVLMKVEGDEQHLEYDITGPAVNLAARMEQTAKPGTIQITKNTLMLVENSVNAKSLGQIEVKGFPNPVDIFALKSLKKGKLSFKMKDRPIYSPFTGRDKEINQLNKALEQTKNNQGCIVNIAGVSGQGKSRICYEFMRSEAAKTCEVLTTYGLFHTKEISLSAISNLFYAIFGIRNLDVHQDLDQIKNSIKLYTDKINVPHAFDAMLSLLGIPLNTDWNKLDPVLKLKYMFNTAIEIITNLSSIKPILLIIEDLQWIDDQTEEFINLLISEIEKFPILLLTTCRMEYHDKWTGKPSYHHILLEPLSTESQELILLDLLGDDLTLVPIKEKILNNSAGNPYFIEEMIKLLISEKVIIGVQHNFQLNIGTLISKAQIPETIHTILQSQLDRLPSLHKKILQVASVIGEQFTYQLISQVLDIDQKILRDTINELCSQQYIYELSFYPEPLFSFKSSMVQEVSYKTLLISDRKILHAKLFEIFENLYAFNPSPFQIQIIAHHAFLGEKWEKAFSYNLKAAKSAFLISALKLSLHFYTQALQAAEHFTQDEHISEQLFHVHSEIAHIYLRLGQLSMQEQHLNQAIDIANKIHNMVLLSIGVAFMSLHILGYRNVNDSIKYAEEAYALANQSKSDDALYVAKNCLIHVFLFSGQYDKLFSTCRDQINSLPSLNYSPDFVRIPLGQLCYCIMFLGWAFVGNFNAESDQKNWEASTNLQEISMSSMMINGSLGYYFYLQGDYTKALPYLLNSLKCSAELEHAISIPMAASAVGCIYLRQGNVDKARKYVYQGVNIGKAIHFNFIVALFMNTINEGLLLLGEFEPAKELIQLSLQICEGRQLISQKPSLFRLEAEVDLQLPNPDYSAIQQRIIEAMELANQLGLKPEVAHCHVALAKTYEKMGENIRSKNEFNMALDMYQKLKMPYFIDQCVQSVKNLE